MTGLNFLLLFRIFKKQKKIKSNLTGQNLRGIVTEPQHLKPDHKPGVWLLGPANLTSASILTNTCTSPGITDDRNQGSQKPCKVHLFCRFLWKPIFYVAFLPSYEETQQLQCSGLLSLLCCFLLEVHRNSCFHDTLQTQNKSMKIFSFGDLCVGERGNLHSSTESQTTSFNCFLHESCKF